MLPPIKYDAAMILVRLRTVVLWLAVFFVLFCCNRVFGGTEPIITTDLLRLRWVTAIDVAKDGRRAVFAVRSIATNPPDNPNDPQAEPTYKYQAHVFSVELGDVNAVPRQLTFGDRQDGMPRLSPDGKRLAFVRDVQPRPSTLLNVKPREQESNAQVWVMPIDGGEARQVTNFKNGCINPRWSPDGSRILVSTSLKIDEIDGVPPWPTERPKRSWKDAVPNGIKPRPDGSREQIRAWLEKNAANLNPNVITRVEFQDELHLRGSLRFAHLFLVDPDAAILPVEQGSARRITGGFYDHNDPVFMPDGQSIIYVAKKPVDQHIDRVLPTNLWRINTDGTNDRLVVALDGWTLGAPKPSRDGAVLAFTGERIDEPAFRQRQLGIANLKSDGATNPVWLTDEATFAAAVDGYDWMHAQPALVFSAAIKGAFPLLTVSPGLVEPATVVSEVDDQPIGASVFGTGGGAIVYAAVAVNNPNTLRVRDGSGDRMVLDLNPWVNQKTLSTPVEGWLTRPDGTKVQYWLMEPTNREQGKRYPLAVQMHGGPAAMWGPGEFTMWPEFQLLCSWGYGVVYCNPRGSGGYGYEFQKKNFQDWGEGPGGDVLGVVDQVVMKDGAEWIDRDKLVLTGGSYAGYLTAWIISHDNRFKAAAAQRGVYDFATFFGEGNAWRLVAWAMGGHPFDPRFKQILDRNNIMNYVSRIRTPLLIEHASNDLRTGVSQSEMLYRALKELNRPVEYVRYPDTGHDMSRSGDPLQRMDRLNRIIEFFDRHVENPRPAPVASGN
jgi:dipeptidyl aminopeptidase/acylaminoacyl peptidase